MSIEVSQLTRFFGRAPAVRQLDMSVPGGAVTGLVGPNGAGKTTLLLMLAGLRGPTPRRGLTAPVGAGGVGPAHFDQNFRNDAAPGRF